MTMIFRRLQFKAWLGALILRELAVCASLSAQVIKVPFHFQEAPAWCWAAASQMVLETLEPKKQFLQPDQAKLLVPACGKPPRDTCDNINPIYDGCNAPGFPSFAKFNYTAERKPSPQPWAELKAELDACRPVLFGWCLLGQCGETSDDSSGHWMVAAAADVCLLPGGERVPMVVVFNPAPCCKGGKLLLPYSIYSTGGAEMKFWQNYFAVRPVGEPVPTSASTDCQLTKAVVDEQRNFESKEDPAKLVSKILEGCFSDLGRSQASKGSIRNFLGEKSQKTISVSSPTQRRIVSLREFAGLNDAEMKDKWESALEEIHGAELLVFPVKVDGRLAGNVVLEKSDKGVYRLRAIEDSETAEVHSAQRREVSKGSVGPITEVVMIETGMSLFGHSGNVVEVRSQSDCRGSNNVPIVVEDVRARLRELAVQFVPP